MSAPDESEIDDEIETILEITAIAELYKNLKGRDTPEWKDKYSKLSPQGQVCVRDLIEKTISEQKGGPTGPPEVPERNSDQLHEESVNPSSASDWSVLMETRNNVSVWMVCDSKGVKLENVTTVKKGRKEYEQTDTKLILPKRLRLVGAWKTVDTDREGLLFSMEYEGLNFQGTKEEIARAIADTAPSGLNTKLVREAVDCCIQHYIETGAVKIRPAFEAVGVYNIDNELHLVLPGDASHPIYAVPGRECWRVFNDFTKFDGDIVSQLGIYNTLDRFFDKRILARYFGVSAIAPFSYALKNLKNSNFIMPLGVLFGPPAVGKSTLCSLFTTLLFGVPELSSSTLTSQFRLLDALTGTTFSRTVPECQDAAFRTAGNFPNITGLLKESLEQRILGERGRPDLRKEIYAARTPLELTGNRVSIDDPALLSRAVIINYSQIRSKPIAPSEKIGFDAVVGNLIPGLGQQLVRFVIEKFQTATSLMNFISSTEIEYDFTEARRLMIFKIMRAGLRIWADFFSANGLHFALQEYVEDKFNEVISFF